jgi:hypothetical protein
VQWSEFRNLQKEHLPLLNQNSFQVPERAASAEAGSYYAAQISSHVPGKTLTVYLRKEAAAFKTVGIERDWPGKVVAKAQRPGGKLPKAYADLTPRQKELIDTYVANYNQKTGFNLAPEAGYARLSGSERTTFDAVTHALSKTELNSLDGKPLGTALDLVLGVERIAGQYYGRQGDEQFRLYCKLKPNARQILEKSREFKFDEENTVYHVGYPHSYRQAGGVPSLQFSMSEEGVRADIDVDYRSNKLPAAMWNGHLRSANSDVRDGNNYQRHNNRWAGLINWWSAVFGNLREQGGQEDDMLAKEPPEPATPLPPNRPPGTQITEVWDATQEMLADWLVRRNGEALEFISDQALACAKLADGTDPRTLTAAEAHRRLQEIMKAVSDRAGTVDNLTEVIEAVIPWRKTFRVVKQPFAREFTIVEAPDGFAEHFPCENRSKEKQLQALSEENPHYGTYYGTVFRFKRGAVRGGVLALLWTKQNDTWRIIAWEVLSS